MAIYQVYDYRIVNIYMVSYYHTSVLVTFKAWAGPVIVTGRKDQDTWRSDLIKQIKKQ